MGKLLILSVIGLAQANDGRRGNVGPRRWRKYQDSQLHNVPPYGKAICI